MVKMLQDPPGTNSYLAKKNYIFPFTFQSLNFYFINESPPNPESAGYITNFNATIIGS